MRLTTPDAQTGSAAAPPNARPRALTTTAPTDTATTVTSTGAGNPPAYPRETT